MSALTNGLRILEAVTAAGRSGLTLTQIVERTSLPKSTTHRLLRELTELAMLSLDEDSRCYRGTLALARIGAAVIENYELRTIARPALEALHAETGQVTTLGIRDNGVGIYVDKIEPADRVIRLHSEIGKQFPLHCTALGKVLLAHADSATRKRLLKRKLEAFAPNTITDAKLLQAELEAIRNRGYAVDNEEITRGLICVAAPVLGIAGEITGAISCTSPSYAIEENGLASMADAVVRHAAMASQ